MGLKSALCGILAFVAWVLQQFGIDFGVEEQTATADAILNIVQGIGILAATIGGLWSKLKDKDKSGLILPVLCLVLVLPGCALKGLEAHEKAMAVAEELTAAYASVHESYLDLHAAFPDERETLEEKVAPKLDTARHSLVALRELVTAWATLRTQPEGWNEALDAAIRALADASDCLREAEERS